MIKTIDWTLSLLIAYPVAAVGFLWEYACVGWAFGRALAHHVMDP